MYNRCMPKKFYFLWDYDLSNQEFIDILEGRLERNRLDQDWALVRLFEYGKYEDIVQLLGFNKILIHWPRLRERIRAEGRKRGFDFLVEWLPEHHPELVGQ